jgi:hypothetical protein
MKTVLAILAVMMTGLAYGDYNTDVMEQLGKENPALKARYDAHVAMKAKIDEMIESSDKDTRWAAAELYKKYTEEGQALKKVLDPERRRIGNILTDEYREQRTKQSQEEDWQKKIAGLEKAIEECRNGYPPNPTKLAQYEKRLVEMKSRKHEPTAQELAADAEKTIAGTWKLVYRDTETTMVYYADHTCKRGDIKGKWEIKTGWCVTTWENSTGETEGVKLPVTDENRAFRYSKDGDVLLRFTMTRVSKATDVATTNKDK